jgi:hypothetical protein
MNRPKLPFLKAALAIICIALTIYACSKGGDDPPADPCANTTITLTGVTNDASTGQSNGSITATASGSSGFTYQLGSGSFQSSGTFNNLAAGNYSITAKDGKGCTKTQSFTVDETDACAGKTITVTPTVTQESDDCSPTGVITVAATGGNGFTYSIDNGAFQASNTFNGVGAGNHTITAKDDAGCTNSAVATVGTPGAGAAFAEVKAILAANCALSGCHVGNAPTGGLNWTIDCTIEGNSARIKARAVDAAGTANQMPPPPRNPLSKSDRDKIVAWINAGGKVSD